MIDPILRSRLVQLFAQGFLDHKMPGDVDESLSGLLKQLGISYAQTKNRLQIESASELLNLETIQAHFSETSLLDSFEWRYRLVTDSTNADALELFEASRQPCIVLAEMQTGGRGRRGRAWVSPFAKNIYCTIGIAKSIEGCNPGLLSIVTGIALCKALQNCGIDDVRLKWPNDLYYENKKLGGILIESRMCGTGDFFFAIGFGINVNMNQQDFEAIPQAATSVNLIKSGSVSRDIILRQAIRQVVQMIDNFDESSVSRVVEAFQAIDAFRNAPISVTTSGQSIDGVNAGINSKGQLLLDTDRGRLEFSAADISIRGQL